LILRQPNRITIIWLVVQYVKITVIGELQP